MMVNETDAFIHAIIQGAFYVALAIVVPWFLARWLIRKSPTYGFLFFTVVAVWVALLIINILGVGFYLQWKPLYTHVGQSMFGALVLGMLVGLTSSIWYFWQARSKSAKGSSTE
jgi:hypothetical protein